MGNAQTESEKEQAFLDIEKRMISHSGLDYDNFKIHNVPVDGQGNYVRTYEIGEGPVMVLIHGYGAASLTFWKIMKPLSMKYRLIMVDQLGMGASSRPDFVEQDAERAVDYLVNWVEEWRKAMDLTGFVLAGHSFGGFISGHYACKYPQHIRKLLMLSPFGVPKRHFTDEEFDEEYKRIEPLRPTDKKPPKFAFTFIFKKVWKNNWSPFGFLRKSPDFVTKLFLNRWAKKRIVGDVPKQELDDFKAYMGDVLLRKGSVEYALFVIFDHFCFAKVPLDVPEGLSGLDMPISFIYGDRDWMKLVGTHTVLENNPYKDKYSHMHTVENSDHHLYLDNPEQFAQIILEDLETLDEIPFPR